MIYRNIKKILASFVLLVLIAFGWFYSISKSDQSVTPVGLSLVEITEQAPLRPLVKINGVEIPVEIATSSADVQRGLSGRLSLDMKSGILFIFERASIYRFWMPDMHFPIDIIWINNGKVVDISKNVSNEFDAKNPRFYMPSRPAMYVLEVNAGFSDRENISIGDLVTLENIDE